jgi:uncharacterized protein with HEPN domain
MPADRDISILLKVIKYCDEIEEAISQFGESIDALKSSSVYRNAVAMCILQIGELSIHLTDEFKTTYAKIHWKAIRGMRNIAAHHYGAFDAEILWKTITTRIPELRLYCADCISALEANENALRNIGK